MTPEMRALLTDLANVLEKHDAELVITVSSCGYEIQLWGSGQECIELSDGTDYTSIHLLLDS